MLYKMSQEKDTVLCFGCKKRFVCICNKESHIRDKEKSCALNRYNYPKSFMKMLGDGIYCIHVCSPICAKIVDNIPDSYIPVDTKRSNKRSNKLKTTNESKNIIIDNETEKYTQDDDNNPFRYIIDDILRRKNPNGGEYCCVCGDTKDQTPLVYIKSVGKMFCTDCRDIQLNM